MTNPNTHPAPTMVYGGAPSFDDAAVPNPFADLRAGLDAAKRLREHLPGDSPELQQADDTIAALEAAIDAADSAPSTAAGSAPSTTADLAERMALADELATLRADNAARGVLIEQLRADRDAAQSNFSITAEALEYMRDERNQAHAAYSRMWGERDAANAELAAAKLRNEALAAELDTVRSERDAAREELTAALLARDEARAAFHRADCDRDGYLAAYNRTLRALNAALGEP